MFRIAAAREQLVATKISKIQELKNRHLTVHGISFHLYLLYLCGNYKGNGKENFLKFHDV